MRAKEGGSSRIPEPLRNRLGGTEPEYMKAGRSHLRRHYVLLVLEAQALKPNSLQGEFLKTRFHLKFDVMTETMLLSGPPSVSNLTSLPISTQIPWTGGGNRLWSSFQFNKWHMMGLIKNACRSFQETSAPRRTERT